MWIEIVFNITYLIVIWGFVIIMLLRRGELDLGRRHQANLLITAFGLLALGDTGHVGFRVWAYALGGLESQVRFFEFPLSLVGIGALMTAVTVTLFYVFMLELWRERFNQKYGLFEWFLIAVAAIRLTLMTLPANEWGSVVPLQPWSTVRNIPLVLLGLGVAYLILRDASRQGDRSYFWIGISILVSFVCYVPVILFVQQVPAIGMLMIPKTMAYVAIALLAYRDLFQDQLAREDLSMTHS
jgi:hypothetical protein